jgi:single-strand DNA-binding protein
MIYLAKKYIVDKRLTIYLEGKIKSRNYEDKAGVKKYVTEIIADSLIMLDKPNGGCADKAEINASFKE